MSLDLIIAPSAGSVGGAPTLTLKHGIQNIAGYASNTYDGIAWIGTKEARTQNPWGKLQIAGVDGDFAKYWGKTVRVFLVKGVIAVRQPTIAATYPKFNTLLNDIFELNEGQFEFNITGPRTIGPVVCDNIETDFLGPNTGSNLFFTLVFSTLEG